MSDSINEACLADVVEFIVDNRGRTAPTEEHGIPLIATNCVSNEHLYPLKEKLRYVSQETYENWFRSHPIPGDILLTNKGSQNGAICLVPDPVDFCIAQDMVALRADQNKIYPLYLFAVLRSRLVQNRIKELNVDAVIPHFKKTDFNKLYFPLLGESEQKFIGDLYFKLSYKIELNHQINQTLESMAQAIFKSWFVDFEPVKAKIAAIEAGEDAEGVTRAAMSAISGKTNEELDQLQAEQPEHYTQLKTTAELFPATMQDSELGEVPEGWEVGIILDFADLLSGGTPKTAVSEYWDGGVPWVSAKDVTSSNGTFILTTEKTITQKGIEKSSAKMLPKFTTVITSRGTVGNVCILYKEMAINQTNYGLKSKYDFGDFFLFFNVLNLIQYMKQNAYGTVFDTITTKTFRQIQITLPPMKFIELFENIVGDLMHKVLSNLEESQSLSSIRDSLLPKLLSGELSVDAAEFAEE